MRPVAQRSRPATPPPPGVQHGTKPLSRGSLRGDGWECFHLLARGHNPIPHVIVTSVRRFLNRSSFLLPAHTLGKRYRVSLLPLLLFPSVCRVAVEAEEVRV